MSDQAAALRALIARDHAVVVPEGTSACEIVTVTSGKGGVGKSNITINVALALARRGRRVLVMDADIGTANIDILLGLGSRAHLGQVFEGSASLYEITVEIEERLFLIPGASGINGLAELPFDKRRGLQEDLQRIGEAFDYLFIDTSAGISRAVLDFMRAADRILLISTGEPTAVVDAYALCKAYYGEGGEVGPELVANNVTDREEAMEVFEKINLAVGHFLKKELKYLGHVVHDEEVAFGVIEQKPVMMSASDGRAAADYQALAEALDHGDHWQGGKGILQLFRNLVSDRKEL